MKGKQPSFADWIISQNISEDDPLQKIFSSVDFSFIRTLVPEASLGREGFDPVSLFKALLLIPLGEARSQRELARKLRFDGRLSYLCGFSYGQTPSHNTFTVFKKRVGEKRFRKILENLISQALSCRSKKGTSLAMDSTAVKAYSQEKFPSDADARWGAKEEGKYFFGYKLHASVIPSNLPLPASVEVSSGEAFDGNFFKPLLKNALKKVRVKKAIADAGYDTGANISFSEENKIEPFIASNPRNSKHSTFLSQLTVTAEGEVFCPAGRKLLYWGKEKRRERIKFRCPLIKEGGECLFKTSCWKGRYGRSFYLSNFHSLSEKMKIFRTTRKFKRIYKKRQAIERFFSLLKENFSLERKMKVRGTARVRTYIYIVVSAYVVSLLARGFG